MKDDEVREFLLRWLMEFGTEPVPWSRRGQCDWYTRDKNYVDITPLDKYFLFIGGNGDCYQLNQAGLNFIKEK